MKFHQTNPIPHKPLCRNQYSGICGQQIRKRYKPYFTNARMYSRFILAMNLTEISFGQTASHS